MTDLYDPGDVRREVRRLLEQTEGRPALQALGDIYTRRLQGQSDDFDATYGLRLVTAKLQRIPYGPPAVSTAS